MISCDVPVGEKVLYQSEDFSLTDNKVIQKNFTAEALSATEIVSDYKSPNLYSRHIEFKFSLNGKDNEMSPGSNHHLVIFPQEGKFTTPIIKFGEQLAENPEKTGYGLLEPNTEVTFKLDLAVVLESFQNRGYFESYDGSKLAKDDFKGVFIAGSSQPLSWDFENLPSNPNMQLKDEDGDGIFELKVVLNVYNPENFTASNWKLKEDISIYPQLSTDILLLDALYNLSLEEAILDSEVDGTFRTGAKWPGVWTRDISYSVVLAFAIIEPEISKNSLRRKVNRNRIIQDTGSGGAWPVSTDRSTWALAAWEIYLVTGDQDWLREAFEVIKNSVEDDLNTIVSPHNGLFLGESSFLDWRKQTYPSVDE